MFAPRPTVAIGEMLRVLKPGGRIAFSTWPPELVIGRFFDLINAYLPPMAGVPPSSLWGDVQVVRERLGAGVANIEFHREELFIPALSPSHYRAQLESTAGPIIKLVQMLADQPQKLATFRSELDQIVAPYFQKNRVRQSFLMTRARKLN